MGLLPKLMLHISYILALPMYGDSAVMPLEVRAFLIVTCPILSVLENELGEIAGKKKEAIASLNVNQF